MTGSSDPTSDAATSDPADVDAAMEKGLDRQLAIWTGMYGPARATEMVAALRARATADDNDRPLVDLAKEIDPDDEDWEEGGLSRPGVG
ncbi:MAG: hypothetical protein ACR2QO_21930 [Acidimicrobiales bacterium]